MQIDSNLIVKVGDAEFVFEAPSLNEWTTVLSLFEKSMPEQADILFGKLLGVRNLSYKDGTPVTVESLKEKRCTIPFFREVKDAWVEALKSARQSEAEAKKDETPG